MMIVECFVGGYGCCPFSGGTCCSDKVHCCASGYSCEKSGDRCTRHLNSFNRTESIRLTKGKEREDSLCPDGKTECSSTSSCCPNEGTSPLSYSCCPYSKVDLFFFCLYERNVRLGCLLWIEWFFVLSE